MKTKVLFNSILTLLLIVAFSNCQGGEPTKKQVKSAEKYFSELKKIADADDGNLWGVNLYGPTMFVFPETRLLIANQQSKNEVFVKKGNIYYEFLPKELNIANTAISFDEELWTLVQWNDFSSDFDRNSLMIHESWHRIQNEIGLPSYMSENQYLDNVDGCILMKLELVALKNALLKKNIDSLENDLRNALIIRNKRQILFPNNNENRYECHEGLAEYTALKLAASNDKKTNAVLPQLVVNQIENNLNKDGYSNYFAYLTGPAYGFILDQLHPDWRKEVLSGKTLNDIALTCVEFSYSDIDSELKSIIELYDVADFIQAETERLNKISDEEKQLIAKFISGNQLIIPNNNIKFSYNPTEKLVQVDSLGVIYKTMRLSGDFGIIEAENGILRASDWSCFILAFPDEITESEMICNDFGYKMEIKPDFKVMKIADKKYLLTSDKK